MAESVKSRIKFPKGEQRKFLLQVQTETRLSNKKLASVLRVSVRTFTDWKREKFTLTKRAVVTLTKVAGIAMPKDISIKEPYWYVKTGASKGGRSILKIYGHVGGDPERRKQKWYQWWESRGKFVKNSIFASKTFKRPSHSIELAEFIGTMMGDGGMSKTQISITLHHKNDLKYTKFVVGQIKKLFGIKPSIYHDPKNSVNKVVVSRTGLVKYLHSLGLPVGNKIKQNFDIPNWVKDNTKYMIACTRGLVDTDGCIFHHSYKVHKKEYIYKKLSFTTASSPLRKSIFNFFMKLGLRPRVSQNRDIRLENKQDIKTYFKIIGSHNPKHLTKYRSVI